MTREEYLAFVDKKSKQKRFIMEFTKPVSFDLVNEDPLLRKELNIVYFNESQTKLEVFVRDGIKKEAIVSHLAKIQNISKERIRIIDQGNRISDLFPI